MAREQIQPFRLMDLPGEIRNKIYQAILCSFDPKAPTGPLNEKGESMGMPISINQATHSIETSILRTSKQVHREAYDVMVKTNHFIKVSSVDITLAPILMMIEMPVVTLDRALTHQFQGYVMSLDMSAVPGQGWVDGPLEEDDNDGDWEDDYDSDIHAPPAGTGPRFNFMILGRDWEAFCKMIGGADATLKGFKSNVQMTLKLNTYPTELPEYKAPISEYFSTKSQEALLKPFRRALRGFKFTSVTGCVDEDLAAAVCEEVAKPLWTNPQKVIDDLQDTKNEGVRLYSQERKYDDANLRFGTGIIEMRRIHRSIEWVNLVDQGGPAFVSRFAELYFTFLLNCSQCILDIMRDTTMPREARAGLGGDVIHNLSDAMDAPHVFMHEGSTWMPGAPLLAKLAYRQAVAYRITGQLVDESDAKEDALDCAMEWIQRARETAPNDAGIEREEKTIKQWAQEVWTSNEDFMDYLADEVMRVWD